MAASGNFGKAPAHNSLAVEQKLPKQLAQAGCFHALVGFRDSRNRPSC
jgi:hypothetical protein